MAAILYLHMCPTEVLARSALDASITVVFDAECPF